MTEKKVGKISLRLLDSELVNLITSTTKIYPMNYDDIVANINNHGFQFGLVVSGEHKNELYVWSDNTWNIIGAGGTGSGGSTKWEDIIGIPDSFTPVPHTHNASIIVQDGNYRFMSLEERVKLTGIEDNANNYTHPEKHPASMIQEGSNKNFVTDQEKQKLLSFQAYIHPEKHSANMITEEVDKRFISDAEKSKLSNFSQYIHPDKHPASIIIEEANKRFMTDAERTKLGGLSNYTHPSKHSANIITEEVNKRFMTDTERSKLGGIQNGANNYSHPERHSANMIDQEINRRFVTDLEKMKLETFENYVHPNTEGNRHMPPGGRMGDFLVGTGSGRAEWARIDLDATASKVEFNALKNEFDNTNFILVGEPLDVVETIPIDADLFGGHGTDNYIDREKYARFKGNLETSQSGHVLVSNGNGTSTFKEFLGSGGSGGSGDYVHPPTHPADMISEGRFSGRIRADSNIDNTSQIRNVRIKEGTEFTAEELLPGEIGFLY